MSEGESFETQAMDRITDILVILSEVSTSAFYSRLPDLPEDDPFRVLFLGVNEMVDTLQTAHDNSERYQRELMEKLETIEQQRAAIRELSTPVIEVWKGVLCLPVVGVMDTTRSAEMTDMLLRSVVEQQAKCTIIDVTGIEVMDTATADHFLRMARSVRLLGAECVVTGISPAIAQTIVHMGVDLSGLTTHRSLRDALAQYVQTRAPSAHGGSELRRPSPTGPTTR
jgi:rsbT co-antagonist protein RsbR